MRIVSFDPGLNLGWAISDGPKNKLIIKSGCIKNDSKIPIQKRQIVLVDFIEKLIEDNHPDKVIVEAINRVGGMNVYNQRNASTWALYWIYGEILHRSERNNIEVISINPLTMKAAVTDGLRDPESKGHASKSEVINAVKILCDNKSMRSDEADAVGLALTYWMIYNGEYKTGSKNRRKK